MILRMLRTTEWGQLLDFVSPSFFDVVPARALAGAAKNLIASTRDAQGFEEIAAGLRRLLAARGLPIVLASGEAEEAPAPAGGAPLRDPRARGSLLLRLYFEQLLGAEAALLDLRGSRFTVGPRSLAWSPMRGFVRWDPAFLGAIRRMYRGFYAGEDAEFHAGLEALQLDSAADLFLEHFGTGDQRAVRFEMKNFTRSFHAVFVRCRASGVSLHPDFVPLGVHLASLYEHLESLGVPLDVRAAFAEASA